MSDTSKERAAKLRDDAERCRQLARENPNAENAWNTAAGEWDRIAGRTERGELHA